MEKFEAVSESNNVRIDMNWVRKKREFSIIITV